MNRLFYLLFLSFLAYSLSATITNHRPMAFIENCGQIKNADGSAAREILYSLYADNMRIDIKKNGIDYSFFDRLPAKTLTNFNEDLPKKGLFTNKVKEELRQFILKMNLINTNHSPMIIPLEEQPYFENIYSANLSNSQKAKSFSAILIKNIYQGIDWKIYSKDGTVKYDFLVSPGADSRQIKICYTGADEISLESDGSLTIKCPLGILTERTPYTYELNSKKEIVNKFVIKKDIISFDISPSKSALVIDPEVLWCTYYGGNGFDAFLNSVKGSDGLIYFVGITESKSNVTSENTHSPTYNGGATDGLIVCMDTSGHRVWATYFGGTGIDGLASIAIDQMGFIYVIGSTNTLTDMTTPGAFQPTYGGGPTDILLAKFTSAGQLIWSTYYGGTLTDGTWLGTPDFPFGDIKISDDNFLYLTSITNSPFNIATSGAHQKDHGGDLDAIVAKFDTAGQRIWASYYGGTEQEYSASIAIDQDNIYICGSSESTNNISSPSCFKFTKSNSHDAFVAKFNHSGDRIWGTYYGGNGYDELNNIRLDKTGNLVFLGSTSSSSGISSSGAEQPVHGGDWDGFLVKFTPAGKKIWGTYIGGQHYDYFFGLDFDVHNNILVVGMTTGASNAITTPDAFQLTYGGGPFDAAIAVYNESGFKNFGSYYGGSGNDRSFIIIQNNEQDIYICGETNSISLGKGEVHQTQHGGGLSDVFFMKFDYPEKLGIFKPASISEMATYPNPATDFIFLESRSVQSTDKFHILDLNGNEVLNGVIQGNGAVNIKNLAPGNYIINWYDSVAKHQYYSRISKI